MTFRSVVTVLWICLRVSMALAFPYGNLGSRATFDPNPVSASYDFVVVGGGLAGLVVAARLAEDSAVTVLVLEAGGSGDDVRNTIDHPGLAYYDGLLHSEHDWGYVSIPQPNVKDRTMEWPGGKILGGSSAVNGAYLVRPSAQEIDAWHGLVSGLEGADNWSSETFWAAMDKSETFTPPSDEIQQRGNIEYEASSHGEYGPIHASYPAYLPELVGLWVPTLEGIGIHASTDPSGGDASGAYVTTSTINPTNWTRSYSRSAYIDPYYRPNLHILTNAQVTRVVFDGKKATSVEYGSDGKTVGVGKEVILSAGPIGSPATLMRSGVGPRDVLDGAGVSVVVELPGVGQHLQDHLSTQVVFRTSAETARSVYNNADDPRSTTSEFLSYVNSAIAYASTAELLGDAGWWRDQVMAEIDNSVDTLVPSDDASVRAGYRAIYEVSAQNLLVTNTGQLELLLSTTGSSFGADTIAVQAALQRPFSHGRLYINSSNPFDPPVIDPGYLTHSADIVMLREGLKLARSIGETEPMKGIITEELSPGANVTTDADWDAWILDVVHTEYHPSCSCSMLPQDLGGVVDAKLRVYGLDNVRVVDSSVFPIEWAAHMMAPTYGLAEQAAIIIKGDYSLDSDQADRDGSNRGNGALSLGAISAVPTLFAAVLSAVTFALAL